MDKIEMLIGYDINFYKKKFNDNSKKVATYLYNFLKRTIGNRVYGISIDESLLQAWSYYFLNIMEENPSEARKVLISLSNQFTRMMVDKDNIKIRGDITGKLVLDKTFCGIWFANSLNLMLIYQYGKDSYKKAFECIKREFLSNESKVKTLVIA